MNTLALLMLALLLCVQFLCLRAQNNLADAGYTKLSAIFLIMNWSCIAMGAPLIVWL